MESNQNYAVNRPVLSPEEELHRKEASSSMVLGIIGDVLIWYPVVGIAGLVLSIIALVKSNRNRQYAFSHGVREHGMNVAGRWCGIGGIIAGAIMLLLYLAAIALMVLAYVGFARNTGFFDVFSTSVLH